MSALDDMSLTELERLELKYCDDTTGFLRQVQTAIKGKYIDESHKGAAT